MNAFTETETPVIADEATSGPIGDESLAVAQTGAVSFSELVRAHFDWDRAGCPDGPMRVRFATKLQAFEEANGPLTQAYWSTKRASAVGLRGRRSAQSCSRRSGRSPGRPSARGC